MGSWATSQPPGLVTEAIRTRTASGSTTCIKKEAAVGKVDLLGQDQLFGGLGDGHDLRFPGLGGGLGHLVPPGGVDVDGVNAAAVADHRGQGHGHVAAAGADVGAAPARAQAQPVEGSLQRAAVDIVAQVQLGHSAKP